MVRFAVQRAHLTAVSPNAPQSALDRPVTLSHSATTAVVGDADNKPVARDPRSGMERAWPSSA